MNMLTRTFGSIRARLGRARVHNARPGTLASLAGQPAGLRQSRRGTVLVLILGALALISVVTLVYVIVGRGDRQTSGVVNEKNNVDNAVAAFKDYAASTIAKSALTVFTQGQLDPSAPPGNAVPNLVRKHWDFPYTDPYRRSILTAGTQDRRFDPTGSYSDLYTGANPVVDPRQPYEPWLATTSAIELPKAPFGPPYVAPPPPATPRPTNTNRDWGHISNFSPDGRFANLYNLAPRDPNAAANDLTAKRLSAFDALPIDPTSTTGRPQQPRIVGGRLISEMGWGLTLNQANGDPYPADQPQKLPTGQQADPNVPAHWTMWQRGAFKLANADPYHNPGELGYLPYQWCDTDGDGFYDARWIELVDASDPANPISFMPRDDRFRWFVAVRAVDLSALANVNVATDLRRPAQETGTNQVSKLGIYPEIDLLRLFRMSDLNQVYGANANGYTRLQQGLNGDNFAAYDFPAAQAAGENGYGALRLSLRPDGAAVVDRGYSPLRTQPNGPLAALTADERVRYFLQVGGQSTAQYYVAPARSLRFSGRFGAADLQELLTRRTVNDPGTLSRLEQTVDGRWNEAPNNGGSLATRWFGPLRSSRSLAVERLADEALAPNLGFAADSTFARIVNDLRSKITTISWSRPLISKPVTVANASRLTNAELATDAYEAAQKISNQNIATRDPRPLFNAYAEALLPGSNRPKYWDASATGNYQALRTTAFAHSPELALRIAGFMTANFGDLYDRDNNPSAYTLLIDDSFRNQVGQAGGMYPWWATAGAANPGRLDLTTNFLPKSASNATVNTRALNIYGIEAQPFITQVVSFCIYTDAPSVLTGASEEYPGPNLPLVPITIKGTVPVQGQPANPDFLGQVLAFQLTNPFDVVVPLTQRDILQNYQAANDRQFSDFYIEYAKRFFMMVTDEANGPETIVLRPGETRNFYILSNRITDMQARWNAVTSAVAIAPSVEGFLNNQLGLTPTPGVQYDPNRDLTQVGGRVKPIRLKWMDATTGQALPWTGTEPRNIFDPVLSTDLDRKNVYLWRNIGGAQQGGDRTKHVLADRLRDPGQANTTRPTLDRTMPAGQNDIDSTAAGPEWWPTIGAFGASEDNTGFTIALWGSVKRHDDPNARAGLPSPFPRLGGLPAYCLEPKWASGQGGNTFKNIPETDGAKPDALTKTDFTGPDNSDITVPSFLAKTTTLTANPPPGNNPGGFSGVMVKSGAIGYATITARCDQKHGPISGTEPNVMRNNGDNVQFDRLYPSMPFPNNEFTATLNGTPPTTISTLRIADMLLPYGIGPCNDPGLNPAVLPNGVTLPPDTFMTLSEAMAVALNYCNPPAPGAPAFPNDPTSPRFSIYYHIGSHPTTPPPPTEPLSAGALDRGNLSLDKFIPFVDVAPFNGIFDAAIKQRVFPGIPMGLNVLSAFRTMDLQFGSLTHGTPGLININTADPDILRLLPLLSPTTDTSTLVGSLGQPAYARFNTLSGVAVNDGSLPRDNADVASALKAYRDKVDSFPRPPLTVPTPDTCRDSLVDPFKFNTVPANAPDGRALSTNVPGTREEPGFVLPGEILNVTHRGTPTNPSRLLPYDQIDALARDTFVSSTVGTSSVLYKSSATATTGTLRHTVEDDYTEKLLTANGVLNSITVRSDVFAVWFVMHGYQRSDTEGLNATDPLVPSVAKRFLMVVDRSNVTRLGEKPKILLFTELPM